MAQLSLQSSDDGHNYAISCQKALDQSPEDEMKTACLKSSPGDHVIRTIRSRVVSVVDELKRLTAYHRQDVYNVSR